MATEYDIPGGKAVFADPSDPITERKRRPAKSIAAALGTRFEQIVNARVVTDALGNPLTPEVGEARTAENMAVLQITAAEFDHIWELQDATTWAQLVSWTLDAPLPASPADLADLDAELYDALTIIGGRIGAETITGEGFTVASVEDPASPTGASEG